MDELSESDEPDLLGSGRRHSQISKWGPVIAGAVLLMGVVGLGARKLPGSGSTREAVRINFDIAQAATNFFLTAGGVIAFAALVLIFWPGQDPLDLPKRSRLKYALGPLVIIGLVLLLTLFVQRERDPAPGRVVTVTAVEETPPTSPRGDSSWGFGALLGAIGVALVAIGLRGRKAPDAEASTEPESVDEFDVEALIGVPDDMARGDEPRAQVIRAYAAMIGTFARHRAPRRAPETPREFVSRVLPLAPSATQPAWELTDLFEVARFSRHPLSEGDGERARSAARAVDRAMRGVG